MYSHDPIHFLSSCVKFSRFSSQYEFTHTIEDFKNRFNINNAYKKSRFKRINEFTISCIMYKYITTICIKMLTRSGCFKIIFSWFDKMSFAKCYYSIGRATSKNDDDKLKTRYNGDIDICTQKVSLSRATVLTSVIIHHRLLINQIHVDCQY